MLGLETVFRQKYYLYFRFGGLEMREYGRRDPSRWPHGTFYSQKLKLTSPTSGGHSVGIVRLRAQATEFSFFSFNLIFSFR
jgi:hypothetical protein